MVALPLVKPLGLPLEIVEPTMMFYNYIESLPAGSQVVVRAAALSNVENLPVQLAVLKHLFSKNFRIVFYPTSSAEEQVGLKTYYFPKILESPKYGAYFKNKVYGVDYLLLPYMPGGQQALQSFASDAFLLYSGVQDYLGVGLVSSFPIMQYFKSANDWKIWICAGGEPSTTNEMQIVQSRYGVPFLEMAYAMHWALHQTYLATGQIKGMTNGLRGGAEYERLIGEPTAAGLGGMDAISMTYLMIISLLVWGNVGFFAKKYKERKM